MSSSYRADLFEYIVMYLATLPHASAHKVVPVFVLEACLSSGAVSKQVSRSLQSEIAWECGDERSHVPL